MGLRENGEPAHMSLETWLRENERQIDWQYFAEPWDAMQLRHNPFRDEQIDVIVQSSGILDRESPVVLDLGCGPGVLGLRILALRPRAGYYGLDSDPLMLAAMRHLMPGPLVHPVQGDLRTSAWAIPLGERFDAVVSLTALHWLSRMHQRQLYADVLRVLKPGGVFVVGDPYLPEDPAERGRLAAQQEAAAASEKGQRWNEYWRCFFERCPIRELYLEFQAATGYGEPFEGSDDGYPLSYQVESLVEVGFSRAMVHWKRGLRAVYGGAKGIDRQFTIG